MTNIVEKARVFATADHAAVGQTRKYTGEPYVVHPIEVSELVASVGGTEAMVAAALLHDVLEDTEVTVDVLEEQFGSEVADLVLWLTDISKPEDGNRSTRKALDRQHSAAAPAAAQTIKVADLISNTRTIVEFDPGFARTYLEEKRLLLEVLTRANPTLLDQAKNQIG
jgi:(p)ppGpp synthase/HD superfamily hydrolase